MVRDPRKDPRPGDGVKLINGVEAFLFMREGDWLYVHLSNGRRLKIALENWQRDCETAEVLYVASE